MLRTIRLAFQSFSRPVGDTVEFTTMTVRHDDGMTDDDLAREIRQELSILHRGERVRLIGWVWAD